MKLKKNSLKINNKNNETLLKINNKNNETLLKINNKHNETLLKINNKNSIYFFLKKNTKQCIIKKINRSFK